MAKSQHKVRLAMIMDVMVSEDYLKQLQDNLHLEILKHCFKNNSRRIIAESITIVEEEAV
jgi:hypothetical protein